ncbi:MAG: efflux RND transporter periplasmic adaptor subunit [Bacteriovorax sp.]|nr:efflux RND transporter periplasmic adaptor subunit [Bacteriovorax sp.]
MADAEKSKMKKIIAIILIFLVVGVSVKLIFFRRPFYYAGTIETTKVDISARVTSVIATLNIKEGDHVTTNQLLMTLSCEDYKLDNQIATQDFLRSERLYKQGSLSKEIFDQMRNRKDDSDLKISWCNITSPLNGIVLNKYHEIGEMVTPGTRLLTLGNLKNDIYANIYIPQNLVSKISIGKKLTGYLPESNMQEFIGTVTQIAEEAEFTPKNVQTREERTRLVYAIKITFNNPDEILKPGMTIEVKINEEK